jgi:hypothetical protein
MTHINVLDFQAIFPNDWCEALKIRAHIDKNIVIPRRMKTLILPVIASTE